MITIENTALRKGKVHCETCPKTLSDLPFTEEQGGQALLNILSSIAENHQHHHPQHNLTILIYHEQPAGEPASPQEQPA